jgi:hypothetical protein
MNQSKHPWWLTDFLGTSLELAMKQLELPSPMLCERLGTAI